MSTPMKRWQAERLAAALVLGVALSTVTACEKNASGLTEWTPADHDHQAEPRQRRTMANMAQKASPHSAPSQKNQVIDVTWGKQCATCHGRRGKGDGPSSTMVKARDLTNPEFQASVSDEQLAKVIREGKDKMPAFNLPDSIVQGLVQHVRGFAKRDKGRGRDNDDSDLTEAPGADEAAAAHGAAAPPAAAAAPGAAPNAPASASAAPPGGQAHGADTSGQPPTLTPAPSAAPAAPAKAAPSAAPAKATPPAAPAKAPAPAGSTPAAPANHP
jgi:cbb3-type cytochrome c oxidase subunit III